ncbi:aldo/keto reductase [Synoicihabitans lomoniglobus]|uniref:Aldo/keto reductase n=1 Tax=Synoicihabitans lomoniglobus TaxID=2909285 RepID=A0AAE9ZXE9_9BACT|nr:aldo/keto reductase [Opitutaceae bacterium LMO-M01]WED64313.1 aldo/keto reductase [Opitutaceae bacterium LMO-M01]
MQQRSLGKTGRAVGEIGLGTWQLGANWGDVSEEDAIATLQAAVSGGVNFLDTADVYGAGRSETIIGEFLSDHCDDPDEIFVATKLGRGSEPGGAENFTRAAVRQHTEDSLERLGVDALDLTQLHCVPTEVLKQGELLGWLDELKTEGKIKAFGASVESMDEALFCIEDGRVASLQIIFNVLRQKPVATLFEQAKAANVGLIVRLPLASGLLGGKMSKYTTFAADDHRNFNRDGQAFNVGETFSGLPFETGLELIEDLRPLVPEGMTMAQMALRWILDHDAVSAIIPGARNPEQVAANLSVAELPPLGAELHAKLAEFYANQVAAHIRGPY